MGSGSRQAGAGGRAAASRRLLSAHACVFPGLEAGILRVWGDCLSRRGPGNAPTFLQGAVGGSGWAGLGFKHRSVVGSLPSPPKTPISSAKKLSQLAAQLVLWLVAAPPGPLPGPVFSTLGTWDGGKQGLDAEKRGAGDRLSTRPQ